MDNEKYTCADCKFSDLLVTQGDIYTIMSPHGDEIERAHSSTVLRCRYNPPISDTWSQVYPSDWCAKFELYIDTESQK